MTNIKQAAFLKKRAPMINHQRGLVLLVTLLALVIMMLASVALIRSTDANLQIAGNMAFKRDLINQAERAIPNIQQLFKTGVLKDTSARYVNNASINYYATVLKSNSSGIPDQLSTIVDNNSNPITDTSTSNNSGVTIYYVIDRMCLATGEESAQKCVLAGNDVSTSVEAQSNQLATVYPVYRMTLRIKGPRNTEAYLQTTYTD